MVDAVGVVIGDGIDAGGVCCELLLPIQQCCGAILRGSRVRQAGRQNEKECEVEHDAGDEDGGGGGVVENPYLESRLLSFIPYLSNTGFE